MTALKILLKLILQNKLGKQPIGTCSSSLFKLFNSVHFFKLVNLSSFCTFVDVHLNVDIRTNSLSLSHPHMAQTIDWDCVCVRVCECVWKREREREPINSFKLDIPLHASDVRCSDIGRKKVELSPFAFSFIKSKFLFNSSAHHLTFP